MEKKRTKMRDYLFFSSAVITLEHGRGFVSPQSQIFRRYEKGLCSSGRIRFYECTNAPCSSYVTCIIFDIRPVYYNHPYCFFYCDPGLTCTLPSKVTNNEAFSFR